MNDDRFLEQLREQAEPLRFEPDARMRARIAARVRGRLAASPTVAQFLARWFRPVAASLTAIALAGTVSLAWIEKTSDTPSIDSLSAGNPVEISVAGDSYLVNE